MTAISEYFRTALVIDDRVQDDYGPLEELRIDEREGHSGEPQPGLITPPADDATPVHASALVSAFIDKGIVCGVIQPEEDDGDLLALARRGARIADLLILDWLLFGEDTTTIAMISAVAEANKERLTVVVIFTGALSLSNIVERLTDETDFQLVDDFMLRCDDTVVVVFGKPGITLVGGEDQRTAEYRDLPARIRDDLETFFGGLMPQFVFRGVNAVRDSTPRILASFGSDLDAGALVHRALLPQADDAGPQFIRLLAGDLEQALHDAGVGAVWSIDSAAEPLARATSGGTPSALAERLRRSENVSSGMEELADEPLAREALAGGLRGIGLGDSAVTNAVDDLTAALGDGVASSEALAVMMSCSDFGQRAPRLELGVVLRDDSGNYWLCIQPLCDSVRVKCRRAFPMLRLIQDHRRPAAMIRSPENTLIGVRFDTTPYRLAMPEFEPTSAEAVVADGQPPDWRFTAANGATYVAVTRLRPELAAQAVQGLTSAASRPGFDASEWLRRKASS
ncbi:MAG: response regulator receiver domain [bacterium]|nr:response regulator receiver domain [bacterium]